MARKSDWLPGQHNIQRSQEPGRNSDNMGFGVAQPGRTPMEDTISGVLVIGGAVALLIVGAVMGVLTIPSALIFMLAVAAIFVALAIWLFIRAHRRQSWRRKYAQRTGQPLVRAWERSPDHWG